MTYTEYYKANNFFAVAKKADEYYSQMPHGENSNTSTSSQDFDRCFKRADGDTWSSVHSLLPEERKLSHPGKQNQNVRGTPSDVSSTKEGERMHHLYFASCTKDGGIYHYVMENGTLEKKEITFCDRPMYLEIDGDTMHVLLMQDGEDKNSALVTYAIQKDGSLGNIIERVNTLGVEACHLSTWKNRTFVANYGTGSIFASDGCLVTHQGSGPNPNRQEAAHVHFVKPTPDEKYLFAVDLGMDTIFTYDDKMQVVSAAKVPNGGGCRHLAYAGDGKTVFAANELTSTVSAFSYEDGSLTLLETVAALQRENENNTAAAIRVKGNCVYVTNRGDDAVSCLHWDGKHLKLFSEVPVGGVSPRDMLIYKETMIVCNERDGRVTFFDVCEEVPKKLDRELQIPGVLCVVVCDRG